MPDDDAVDRDGLFALPPADFISARGALVRSLKAQGAAQEAAEVAALRRPTLAAWAVNQVVRRHGDRWAALVAAGGQAQRAQRRALSGVRDTGLREAMATRRELVEELTDLAAAALTDAGARPSSHLDDAAATFEAASGDPTVAEEVGRAQLAAPVRVTSDLSLGGFLAAVPPPGRADEIGQDAGEAAATASGAADAAARRDAMRTMEAARAAAARSAAAARTARLRARDLASRAQDARAAAIVAREAATAAEVAADQAEAAAGSAATRAATAASEAETAAAGAQAAAEAADAAGVALDALAPGD